MDSGRSNETEWPNNTLLSLILPADGQGEGERGRWGAHIISGGTIVSTSIAPWPCIGRACPKRYKDFNIQ